MAWLSTVGGGASKGRGVLPASVICESAAVLVVLSVCWRFMICVRVLWNGQGRGERSPVWQT